MIFIDSHFLYKKIYLRPERILCLNINEILCKIEDFAMLENLRFSKFQT